MYNIILLYILKKIFSLDEAVEHFELLTKITPEWCQFSTNNYKNDLLTINTSIPSRDALEEGIKNFDEP